MHKGITMKAITIFALTLLCSLTALGQDIQWFGPIAGVGTVNSSGNSTMKDGIRSDGGSKCRIPATT